MSFINANKSYACSFGVSAASTFIITTTKLPITGRNGHSVSSGDNTKSILRALNMGVSTSPTIMRGYIRAIKVKFVFTPRFGPTVGCIKPIEGRLNVHAIFGVLKPLSGPSHTETVLMKICSPTLARIVTKAVVGLKMRQKVIIDKRSGVSRVALANRAAMSRVGSKGMAACAVAPRRFKLGEYRVTGLRNKSKTMGTRVAESVLSKGRRKPGERVILLGTKTTLCVKGGTSDVTSNVTLTTGAVSSKTTIEALRTVMRTAGTWKFT